MTAEIGKSPKPLTLEERVERAEKQLAEALSQLQQERQNAGAMAAKLQELNIPLDFLPTENSSLEKALHNPDRQPASVQPSTIQRIYTDGACSGNPGPGGWGTVVYFTDGSVHEMGGFDPQTTNNRMEMQAAIEALRYLKDSGQTEPIELYTDSEYVKNGITQWIKGWKKKGWKTSTGKPVLNPELWQQLDALNSPQVQWRYVRGHSGDRGNDRCDEIARSFSLRKPSNLRQKR
ncbi:MAG: ribonuclease HI [Kovacikia sp.]